MIIPRALHGRLLTELKYPPNLRVLLPGTSPHMGCSTTSIASVVLAIIGLSQPALETLLFTGRFRAGNVNSEQMGCNLKTLDMRSSHLKALGGLTELDIVLAIWSAKQRKPKTRLPFLSDNVQTIQPLAERSPSLLALHQRR
ncbi:hypothetical protein EJ02DRAFT_29257 [Clathrospora elynae]|uniref:Uncharacterized protein n=1 Tax=Clathrospora elynae TaxID=706981 RepID=A0A6A5SFA7_9PLEO|nr:hypothetical protein EJ02DRAFT_29257 [Clathrospora elynae]